MKIQKDTLALGYYVDSQEIESRLSDLTLFGRNPNQYDYEDYYYEHYIPSNILDRIVECRSPDTIADLSEHSANDSKY